MASIRAAVTVIEPSQSTPLSRPMPSLSSSSARPSSSVITPTGMLMKKIQCQLTASVTTPPTSNPIEPPPTATKMYALMALARWAGSGNSVTIIAMITDDEIAPPMPCTKRAAISVFWSSASPHTAEASVKSGDAGEEDALAAHEVTEPACEQQEAAERDQVGVDDPGQLGLRDVQVALDDGQRDVDDGAVERVHEHRHADDAQGDPAPAIAGARGRDCTHRSAL